jgi:hypothetical protein
MIWIQAYILLSAAASVVMANAVTFVTVAVIGS